MKPVKLFGDRLGRFDPERAIYFGSGVWLSGRRWIMECVNLVTGRAEWQQVSAEEAAEWIRRDRR